MPLHQQTITKRERLLQYKALASFWQEQSARDYRASCNEPIGNIAKAFWQLEQRDDHARAWLCLERLLQEPTQC